MERGVNVVPVLLTVIKFAYIDGSKSGFAHIY